MQGAIGCGVNHVAARIVRDGFHGWCGVTHWSHTRRFQPLQFCSVECQRCVVDYVRRPLRLVASFAPSAVAMRVRLAGMYNPVAKGVGRGLLSCPEHVPSVSIHA